MMDKDLLVMMLKQALEQIGIDWKIPLDKVITSEKDNLAHIRELMAEGLEQAKKNRAEQTAGQKNNTAEAVRYSIHSDSLGDYVKVDVEQNIFDIVIYNIKSSFILY